MMLRKSCLIVLFLFVVVYSSGCARTIPVSSYTPQNFIRYNGSTDIGKFEYAPASTGKVAPNQIQNSVFERGFYLAVNVVDFVQRATTLELEKTGFIIGDKHPLQLSGEVLEFMFDDLWVNIELRYSIRYKIIRKTDSVVLLDKVYKADPKKIGRSEMISDFSSTINEMVLSGYEKFIRDDQVRHIYAPQNKAEQ